MPRPLGRRALARSPLMALALVAAMGLSLFAGVVRADSERIATILVKGLQRIPRDRLLLDLEVDEGDRYRPGLEVILERRGRTLSYIKDLRAESQTVGEAVHLSLWVREASRLQVRPYITTLTDGDLAGGFLVEGTSLIRRHESWRGNIQVGGRSMARVQMLDVDLGARWLPDLSGDAGLLDWDNPFWQVTEQRQYWATIGPSLRLPASGRLAVLGGREQISTDPNRGLNPEGTDYYWLILGRWHQPVFSKAMTLLIDTETRIPEESRQYSRGTGALKGLRQQGRWLLSSRLAAGFVNAWSPTIGLYYLSSWQYLWTYEPGTLPAREFYFLRLRSDLHLFNTNVRMRRGDPHQVVRITAYLQGQGSAYRLTRQEDFGNAMDFGIGMGFILPTGIPSTVSLGLHWNVEGDNRVVFIIEQG